MIPSNFMAVKTCEQLEEILTVVYKNDKLARLARVLGKEIEKGILKHALKVVNGKQILAYGLFFIFLFFYFYIFILFYFILFFIILFLFYFIFIFKRLMGLEIKI